jgi:hypothetical protein
MAHMPLFSATLAEAFNVPLEQIDERRPDLSELQRAELGHDEAEALVEAECPRRRAMTDIPGCPGGTGADDRVLDKGAADVAAHRGRLESHTYEEARCSARSASACSGRAVRRLSPNVDAPRARLSAL